MNIEDPIERIVAKALIDSSISFIHESSSRSLHPQKKMLDFYLPDYDVFIEVKQFSTPRTETQLKDREDIILIQGRLAATAFAKMLAR